jgi:pimeloyl-ACP methyl ester carboxylesterase
MEGDMSTIHALLVGIDEYPNPDHRLGGCCNDVAELEELLKLRIPPAQLSLRTLRDSEAAREAVITEFSEHLGRAAPGDTAFFYFAGHGSREHAPEVFWPMEPDRLDETLVLFDSRQPGGWDLADKELAALIMPIAKKGAHVVVVLDCCHSGSGTREITARTRESVRRLPTDARDRPIDTFLPQVQAVAAAVAAGAAHDSGWDLGDEGRHVLLAACCDDEEAAEYSASGKKRGSFSYFLFQTLREAAGTPTYRDLAAVVRARVIASVAAQTPQAEATIDADLDRPFLGGAITTRAQAFVASDADGDWWIDGGRIHGVPPPRDSDCARVALFDATASAADMESIKQAMALADVVEVEATRSRLSVTKGALTTARVYKAALIGQPLPSRLVRLSGSDAAVQAVRAELQASAFVAETPSGGDFHLVCEDGALEIRRATDERALLAPLADAREAVQTLEHLTRWLAFAELDNPLSAIGKDEFEVAVIEGANGEKVLPGTDLRLTAARDAKDALVPPQFRVRLRNRGTRDLYFGILALDELFSASPDLIRNGVIRLGPGQEGWALNGKALKSTVPQALRDEGRTVSRDILKVIVSTADFQIRHGSMPPLSGVRTQTRGAIAKPKSVLEHLLSQARTRTISAADDEDEVKDFCTHTIVVTTTEPRAGVEVSATAAADLGAGVRIRPHPSLSAEARLTTLSETRSDVGASILPPLFRADDQSTTVRFTASRGSAPSLCVLELNGVARYDSVTKDSPLAIELPEPTQPGDLILPVAWDGEDYLVLGTGGWSPQGTVVTLSRLPHPVRERRRSLTGSIKILFQKFASKALGKEYKYPLLAVARWDANGKVAYDQDLARIKAMVADAKRIVVFVHGIIGDTLAMGARLQPRPTDLFLAFDYENLNTTIEENAESLRQRLLQYGLTEGHGKEVIVVAHSMGGLVTRWMVEKLDGHKLVSRVILCGTPNAGSNWATLEDWLTGTMSLVLNGLAKVSWEARAAGWLFAALEKIDDSLDEMKPGSDFLQSLAALGDPAIPYTVLAGNTSLAGAADGGRVQRVLRKVLHHTTSIAFLFEPNDIAVSVKSIGAVGSGWGTPPVIRAVACDHMSYFASDAGLKELRAVLEL